MNQLPPTVVFAFVEDGLLELLESPQDAARKFKGIDVESGVVSFYNGEGQALKARFASANASGRLFGLLPWVKPSAYELVHDSEQDEPFALALHEAPALQENEWVESLDALKLVLSEAGTEVDSPFRR